MVAFMQKQAEPSSFIRDFMTTKTENIYYLTHYRKNLPTSGLTNTIKGKTDSIKITKKTQFIEADV